MAKGTKPPRQGTRRWVKAVTTLALFFRILRLEGRFYCNRWDLRMEGVAFSRSFRHLSRRGQAEPGTPMAGGNSVAAGSRSTSREIGLEPLLQRVASLARQFPINFHNL